MDDDKTAAAAELLEMIQRQAMEALQLPAQEREEHLAELRTVLADVASKAGLPADLVDRMDEWVREMVKIVAAGGGASGGRA